MKTQRWWLVGLALTMWACDDDDDAGGSGCIPGQSAACACESGATGAQVCQADETFGACVCAPATDGATDSATGGDMGSDATATDAGRDASPFPDASPPDAAPVDMMPDAMPGHRYLAGWRDGTSSNWAELPAAMGAIGLEAGHAQCRFLGGDHVCDYTELRAAEAAGELANVPEGTTGWVQRTTPEMVNGQLSEPGRGGNCVDWTFVGNHLADGEYVAFGPGGVATWFLDNDTFFDGIDMTHVQAGQLECSGVTRTLFCCNALPGN